MQIFVDGIGVLGPGLNGWAATRELLRAPEQWQAAATQLPAPERLPPAERRRASRIIRATLGVGEEAARMAGQDVALLPSIFASSSGDGQSCHDICVALASPKRLISPTGFHNSVHNVAAGYWSIATGAMAPAAVLCAYDASFAAGLLEALTQVAASRSPVILFAYDTHYPEPLHATRPVPDTFAVALVLSVKRSDRTQAAIRLSTDRAFTPAPATAMSAAPLEALRQAIPAARCLPLLQAMAEGRSATLAIEYLAPSALQVEVTP